MTVTAPEATYADKVPGFQRRRGLWAGATFVVLLIAALFWIGIRAAQAQHAMSHASDRFIALQTHLLTGDAAAASKDVSAINKEAARARSKTGDWVFVASARVPYLGRTPRSVRSLAQATDDLAAGPLRSLLSVSSAVIPKDVRGADGTIDLTALAGSSGELQSVVHQLQVVR